MSLEAQFNRRLLESIEASIALGYRPTRFIEMLNSTDGATLAKKLIRSGEIQDGMKQVKSMGRPDLTMESIMLEEAFLALFTDEERDAARWRLQQL